MWKKDDRQDDVSAQRSTPLVAPMPEPAAAPPPATASAPSNTERATIGRSITLRGDVTGDEDLMIQGRIEGSVDLQQHSVTVGRDGEVVASIVGRVVTVEGRVEGNISGGEQVILRSSAMVKGDISAPRVVLENGARFRGLVDMGEGEEEDQAAASRPDTRRSTENGKAKTEAAVRRGGSGSGTAAESGAGDPRQADAGAAPSESGQGSSGSSSAKAKSQDEVAKHVPA